MLTIRKSTVNLLTEFAASGGRIIALEMPAYIDGKKDAERLSALKKIVTLTDSDQLPSVMQKEVIPDVTITGDNVKDMYG